MNRRSTIATTTAALLVFVTAHAQVRPIPGHLEIKFVRDSAEYEALTRQVYRLAEHVVAEAAKGRNRSRWAVVLDVDETALDNSVYQLDRAAYGLAYEAVSWKAWVLQARAPAVPGAADFVGAVRRAGGHVAWITNRDVDTVDATRANLQTARLWNDDDRLCGQEPGTERSKRDRRAGIVAGAGSCSWSGHPTEVLAFVGDQMGDFPTGDERIPGTGSDSDFGRTCFLLPNPMYGEWAGAVTRSPVPPGR